MISYKLHIFVFVILGLCFATEISAKGFVEFTFIVGLLYVLSMSCFYLAKAKDQKKPLTLWVSQFLIVSLMVGVSFSVIWGVTFNESIVLSAAFLGFSSLLSFIIGFDKKVKESA